MNTKAQKHHPSNHSHLKGDKRMFFTQREMRRMRMEEQMYPTSYNQAHTVLEGEIQLGPKYSGIPSHRRCHKPYSS
jgi:hypothetical protein